MASGGGPKRAGNSGNKNKSSKSFTCPICEESINDKSQASIFCSGVCQTWIHSGCGGLSPSALEGAKNSGPFHCPSCRVHYQFQELSQLKQEFADLSQMLLSRIASLEAKLTSVSEELSALRPLPHGSEGNSSPNDHSSDSTGISTSTAQPAHLPSSAKHSNRKLNLIFHNIPDSPSNTSFTERLKHDFDAVTAAIDSSVSSNVQDCVRLGRYRADGAARHPRPVLVKFTDTRSALSVLTQSPQARQSGVIVKRDLSKDDRQINSILLKERYRLVSEESADRRSIKFRGSKLFVNGRFHGAVRSGVFVLAHSLGDNASPLSSPPISKLMVLPLLMR